MERNSKTSTKAWSSSTRRPKIDHQPVEWKASPAERWHEAGKVGKIGPCCASRTNKETATFFFVERSDYLCLGTLPSHFFLRSLEWCAIGKAIGNTLTMHFFSMTEWLPFRNTSIAFFCNQSRVTYRWQCNWEHSMTNCWEQDCSGMITNWEHSCRLGESRVTYQRQTCEFNRRWRQKEFSKTSLLLGTLSRLGGV